MRSLTIWGALALGVVGLGACSPYPDPNTPIGCVPRPDDREKIAELGDDAQSGTDSRIRATEPYTEQKSLSPGGADSSNERRYFEDKDETHLEKRRLPSQFDKSYYCPEEPTSEEAPVSS